VRGYGTKVVLIEPTSADLRAMGRNLMSPARRDDVIAMAEHTVARELRSAGVRGRLEGLPAGESHMIARPAGPPSAWPAIGPSARKAA